MMMTVAVVVIVEVVIVAVVVMVVVRDHSFVGIWCVVELLVPTETVRITEIYCSSWASMSYKLVLVT